MSAPASANLSAIACPRPWLAPVIIATLPSRLRLSRIIITPQFSNRLLRTAPSRSISGPGRIVSNIRLDGQKGRASHGDCEVAAGGSRTAPTGTGRDPFAGSFVNELLDRL